ncbi:MAG: DeoR/GlpR family DNA-binding transcription regulator [Candidatus Velthaea sp.]|jgi:DeoR/GlpR family transcriptional regulator of sugar metabolism
MLAFERRMALAELLKANPVLTVDELVRRFGVSAQTMRRDFKYLADAGLLTRTHGGAVARSAEALGLEGTFKLRVAERAPEKAAIARAALDLVAPGSTVMMDASTSVLALAQRLPRDIELHAIVNALPIGSELSRRSGITTTLIGGSIRLTSLSASGPLAETMLRRLFADTAFISARGLSLERGLTEASPAESALKEIMIANATRVVALVDSSKLERTALSFFGPVTDIDIVVTDGAADPQMLRGLRDRGIEVRIAGPPSAARGRMRDEAVLHR